MPNPAILLCDSDVLVQFFLSGDLRPLTELKTRFGIQPVVVLEVDLELRWLGKHKDRFVSPLEKALKHKTLLRLDQALFQSFLSSAAPGTSWSSYQALGAQYYGYVQRGEAYTHAAGVALGFPTASNDFKAILTLQAQMLAIPAPVLRFFDLCVFAYECGVLNLKSCEFVRSELLKHGEGLPKAFANSSFEDGLKTFRCRLRSTPGSGAGAAAVGTNYTDPLVVIPL
jgi:hypothetical protein